MNLTSLIRVHFNVDVGSKVYNTVFRHTLRYLVGNCGAFELQALLKPYCVETSAKGFRMDLLKDKSIYFGLKLLALRLSTQQATPVDLRYLFRRIEVNWYDAKQVYNLVGVDKDFRYETAKLSRRAERVRPLTESSTKALFNSVLPDVLAYIRHITRKKLRFIATSSNCEMEDLHSDLQLKAVEAFYQLVPSDKSVLHLTNYLRRTVHNHAINMIKAATTQKRGRLINVGLDSHGQRQFQLTVVSNNQLGRREDGTATSYEDLGTCQDPQMSNFELRFSVRQVLGRYRHLDKKYRLLLLLMGKDDKDFTTWLRSNNVCLESESNSDVQLDKSTSEYLRLVCTYLGVRRPDAKVFLLTVKSHLGYNHDRQAA